MFIDSTERMVDLARGAGTVVFGVTPDVVIDLPGAIVVEPEEGKKYISVDQVRKVIEMAGTRQAKDVFFVFREAEKLREEAENSMLKLLEEPKSNYHFVLLTKDPGALLPTILSRAQVYFLRKEEALKEPPKADERTLELAKRLLVSREGRELSDLAEEIHKKNEREGVLEVLATGIEVAYKSYLATGKRQFLKRIPNLIDAHRNIANNGNVRLHLVADLC